MNRIDDSSQRRKVQEARAAGNVLDGKDLDRKFDELFSDPGVGTVPPPEPVPAEGRVVARPSPPDGRADELARRAKGGDRQAFGDLFTIYWPLTYRICFGYVRQEQDAEDLAGDAWESAFRHLDRYDESRLFLTYLQRITVNKCIDRHRRTAGIQLVPFERLHPDEDEAEYEEPPDLASLAMAQRIVDRDAFEKAWARLSEKYQLLLWLRFYSELSQKETAKVWRHSKGDTSQNVSYHEKRALQELKELLRREGYAEAEGSELSGPDFAEGGTDHGPN